MLYKKYRPLQKRWREAYSPVPFTNNLQLWLALAAFSLSIFAYLYQFVARWWWSMIGIELPFAFTTMPNYAPPLTISPIEVIFGFFGTLFLAFAIYAIISLFIFLWRSIRGVKTPYDGEDIGIINKEIREKFVKLKGKDRDGKPKQ